MNDVIRVEVYKRQTLYKNKSDNVAYIICKVYYKTDKRSRQTANVRMTVLSYILSGQIVRAHCITTCVISFVICVALCLFS